MKNIREVIILKVLSQVNKILRDYNRPGADSSKYESSQFNAIYPNAYKSIIGGVERTADYPLRDEQISHIDDYRLLESVRIGFIPLDRLEEANTPALYIVNATDTFSTTVEEQGNIQNAELYPIVMRLRVERARHRNPGDIQYYCRVPDTRRVRIRLRLERVY